MPRLSPLALGAALTIACSTEPDAYLSPALSLDVPVTAAKTDTLTVRFQYALKACEQFVRADRTIKLSTASVEVWISGTKGSGCRTATLFVLDTMRVPPPRDSAF